MNEIGALRDANLPRLVSDDVPVFLALLGDLFPAVELNRMTDAALERTIRQAALDLKLQPEDIFVTRVIQMHELLQVRHSVFVLGRAGTGKTQVWRTLLRTYALMRLRPVCVDIDPKVCSLQNAKFYNHPQFKNHTILYFPLGSYIRRVIWLRQSNNSRVARWTVFLYSSRTGRTEF